MKLILLPLLFLTVLVSGQSSDTLAYKKNSIGSYYFYNGSKKLFPDEARELIKNNDLAYEEYGYGRNKKALSVIFGVGGGVLIGAPFGTQFAGGDPNWKLAGIGVGVAAFSFVFSKQAVNHYKKSVTIYNAKPNNTIESSLMFGPTPNGLGLTLSF